MFERYHKENSRFVLVRLAGEIDDSQLKQHIHEFNDEAGAKSALLEFVDGRHIEQLNGLTVQGCLEAAASEQGQPRAAGGRLAILVADELQYGMARAYSTIAATTREDAAVFYSMDEALDWLGTDESIDELKQFMQQVCIRPAKARQVELICRNYHRWTGEHLVEPHLSSEEKREALDAVSFVVVSHTAAGDPVFNYGNRAALSLFEMDWDAFTLLHSHQSAEPVAREERAAMLEEVNRQGFIRDYRGVRISAGGRRFRIENGTVWNLLDEDGGFRGQAAMFRDWVPIEPSRAQTSQ